jgi:hypothetical protein
VISIRAAWLVDVLSLASRNTWVPGALADGLTAIPKFDAGVFTHPATALVISTAMKPVCDTAAEPSTAPTVGAVEKLTLPSLQGAPTRPISSDPAAVTLST